MSEQAPEFESRPDDAGVVVGADTRFEGLLSFWGRARVEGTVRGEVVADGLLEVGPTAVVSAQVEVDVLVVEGLVEGEVTVRERLEVRAGGRITATVRTPRLVLDEGGGLEGRLVMTKADATADSAPPASASAA